MAYHSLFALCILCCCLHGTIARPQLHPRAPAATVHKVTYYQDYQLEPAEQPLYVTFGVELRPDPRPSQVIIRFSNSRWAFEAGLSVTNCSTEVYAKRTTQVFGAYDRVLAGPSPDAVQRAQLPGGRQFVVRPSCFNLTLMFLPINDVVVIMGGRPDSSYYSREAQAVLLLPWTTLIGSQVSLLVSTEVRSEEPVGTVAFDASIEHPTIRTTLHPKSRVLDTWARTMAIVPPWPQDAPANLTVGFDSRRQDTIVAVMLRNSRE
ncbi:hypothetical protein RI367_007974 [Sorochytrium milnesiophthora]